MPRITARDAAERPVLCGMCAAGHAMSQYWLCEGCASIVNHALRRAEFHNARAVDLRGAGRLPAALAADQADRWAVAITAEWSQ